MVMYCIHAANVSVLYCVTTLVVFTLNMFLHTSVNPSPSLSVKYRVGFCAVRVLVCAPRGLSWGIPLCWHAMRCDPVPPRNHLTIRARQSDLIQWGNNDHLNTITRSTLWATDVLLLTWDRKTTIFLWFE